MAGTVYLVGAGPGDPGLITVRGLRCLQEADVVVYDRLVDRRLLAKASERAQLVFVGKSPGQRAMEQEEINQYLVERAREGKVVTRLKGGDPFVFGRGGEEAHALAEGGISFEIVPGVTSASAAPAYAGIPLTHREFASHFTVVSGSEDLSKERPGVPWDVLALGGGTLVVVMGWGTLDEIADKLIKGGMAPSTPAALIRWGSQPYQRTVTGTIQNISRLGKEAGLSPPVVAVIGQVVSLRDHLRWFDVGPMFGKRVLVTRSRLQASALSEALAKEGAEPVELPSIQISPLDDHSSLDDAIQSLHTYDWAIFTSANGVEATFDRMQVLGLDCRAFGGLKVGAIGPATADVLARRGIVADFVPPQYVSEAIVKFMDPRELKGAHVLLPRADIGRDDLAKGLAGLGAQVSEVLAYRTVVPQESRSLARELLSDGGVDVVTFTSSSTVVNLLELLDGGTGLVQGPLVACIGPVTARTAVEMGIKVDIVAQEHTIPGLVRALKDHFAGKEGR